MESLKTVFKHVQDHCLCCFVCFFTVMIYVTFTETVCRCGVLVVMNVVLSYIYGHIRLVLALGLFDTYHLIT